MLVMLMSHAAIHNCIERIVELLDMQLISDIPPDGTGSSLIVMRAQVRD